MIRFAFLCIIQLAPIQMDMEPFIVGGERADIRFFSHSAYLHVEADSDWSCGSSIINQKVLLTAAHCFDDTNDYSKMTLTAGSAYKLKGVLRSVTRFAVHESHIPGMSQSDIALIYVNKPFVLSNRLSRVIILKSFPKFKWARVAGWGLIDEIPEISTNRLLYTDQRLWETEHCIQIIGEIPEGSFCAGAKYSDNYASLGDSGSALIINGSVQVGLVSYKMPTFSPSLVVYTNVSHFYKWIVKTSKKLFCQYRNG